MATLRPRRVRPGVVPPGGWHYHQALGGDRTLRVSDADGFDDLVHKVLVVRLANRIPPGDPHEDVDEYICSIMGSHCGPRPADVAAEAERVANLPPKPPVVRFVDSILAWSVGCFKNRDENTTLVPVVEAERRLSICVQCPYNTQWANSCPQCVETARRSLMLLRRGVEIPSRHLQNHAWGCRMHRWDNPTAALMRMAPSHKALDVDQPPHCWARPPKPTP